MARVSVRRTWRERAIASLLFVTLTPFAAGPVSARTPGNNDDKDKNNHETETPIKHVIVLIGENRTFDHLFATYVPQSKDSINNLLSEGIIKADGTPGKNFGKAAQFQAVAPFKTKYFISLDSNEKAPYSTLPEPTLNFSPSPATGEPPPFPAGTPLRCWQRSSHRWRRRISAC
jgi:phospholipase C